MQSLRNHKYAYTSGKLNKLWDTHMKLLDLHNHRWVGHYPSKPT